MRERKPYAAKVKVTLTEAELKMLVDIVGNVEKPTIKRIELFGMLQGALVVAKQRRLDQENEFDYAGD